MKLTREEAIRLHRELWGWLAENPMKDKLDWPGWHEKFDNRKSDCFLCEYAGFDGVFSKCENCPVVFVENTYIKGTIPYCLGGLFSQWYYASAPEERSRLAALIRDLPEKKVESKPKFKVGDRVRVKEDYSNHCPEPKTVVIDNDGNRHIFNGPVTVIMRGLGR